MDNITCNKVKSDKALEKEKETSRKDGEQLLIQQIL